MHFKPLVFLILISFLVVQIIYAHPAELENRLVQCVALVNDMVAAPDSSVPKDLLRRSKAVILFPSVIKAGMGLGGQYGKGVILRRDTKDGTWSPPLFVTLYGGSFGWQ